MINHKFTLIVLATVFLWHDVIQFTTLSLDMPWNILLITCIFLLYTEKICDSWDIPWYTKRMRCITSVHKYVIHYIPLKVAQLNVCYVCCRCSSEVGYQGRLQYISLGDGCWYVGTAAHEIGKVPALHF